MVLIQITEGCACGIKEQFHHPRRSVAMLGDVDLGDVLFLVREIFRTIIFIRSFSVDEHYDICILFD